MSDEDFVRAVYAHPGPFWKAGARLDDYGINAVFIHSQALDAPTVQRVRAEGARVFAEFATLNGRGYVDSHPEAHPINQLGERSGPAGWFQGACPTEPGFRQYRLAALEALLVAHDLDGIWMDYLHWHAHFEDPHPVLPETCFCTSCLAAFEAKSGIAVAGGNAEERAQTILRDHDASWRVWRCGVLADWAREIRAVMDRVRPGLLLGNFQCPWRDDEFGGARRRTLGIDLPMLKGLVDVMSPMVFHGRMGRPLAWVGEAVSWVTQRAGLGGPEIWPIVQAGEPQDLPRSNAVISAAEFKTAMQACRDAGARGTMMFHIGVVSDDRAKMEVLRKLYRQWAQEPA